jgi:hypothetical protein
VNNFLTLFGSFREECGVLFSRLFDTQHREALETALQGSPFMSQLTSVLDSINVPANDDMLTRVYSITALQMGNFDDYYEENEDFRAYIQILLYLVEKTGGVLANPVTPDNSPGRRGSGGNDGGGDGGAAGGAAPVAAA